MDWLVFALLGAFFTTMAAILIKSGVKYINTNFLLAYRTLIIIVFSVVACSITGNIDDIDKIDQVGLLYLGLSGVATGASWLCYYKALQLSTFNKVAPFDKSSFVLTNLLFLIFFFDVTTKGGDPITITMLILSTILMLVGTIFMAGKEKINGSTDKKWLVYAILSAVFASIVSILVKAGLKTVPSDLGVFVRAIVIFVIMVLLVFFRKDYQNIKQTPPKTWIFLTLSALATSGAWLCVDEALGNEYANPVVVTSIGMLSILLSMVLSFLFFKEKFTKKSLLGLLLLTIGIVAIIIFGI